MPESSTAYQPTNVEREVYRRWEESGFFNPDNLPGRRGKPFVISMPPSNITGGLHLGHALGMTVQDILIRYHRMRGRRALWLPGTDHAAIATQVVVERELRKEGLDRMALGREGFLRRVWDWKERYGNQINQQARRLGASADWSRERFTMDEGLTRAVQEAFIRLHREGLIYRGERVVNWCPDCRTSISDLEVDHEPTPGKLWYIRYPLTDGQGTVMVATTRPETMLGDTAVAVHPDDQRYRELVGKSVTLPIVNRVIPIVADTRVEREFGTGAVKLTPAHDQLDWEIAQNHSLPLVSVIGTDGRMTAAAGSQFEGQTAQEARTAVLKQLAAGGFLDREEDYIHAVATCSRSGTVIEPLISIQWFVKTAPLARSALQAVEKKKVEIMPERFEKVYRHWLSNIRDWNVSRQIWWGHRLPVWYRGVGENTEVRVSRESPGADWRQDEDTLDTWFSSALWTFATLGWPDQTRDLKSFHPTDVLETAWDILFFWVARMVMLSLHLAKEIPFRTVYLHGLILDREGRKMSRSKGNGIDPVEMIDRYGADALRMSLVIGNAPGQDFRMYEEKVAGYRNFANKLWNIGRFVRQVESQAAPIPKSPSPADAWIESRLVETTRLVTDYIEKFQFSPAGQAIYDFVWRDLADWYVEWTKRAPNRRVLRHVYEQILKLVHPFMPFVTEQLWSEIHSDRLLLVEPWPKRQRTSPPVKLVSEFKQHQSIISQLRTFRAHAALAAEVGEVVAVHENVATWESLSRVKLRAVDRLTVSNGWTQVVLGGAVFQFPTEAVTRFEGWRAKERLRLDQYVTVIRAKLENPDFVARAPAAVMDEERRKLSDAEQARRSLDT